MSSRGLPWREFHCRRTNEFSKAGVCLREVSGLQGVSILKEMTVIHKLESSYTMFSTPPPSFLVLGWVEDYGLKKIQGEFSKGEYHGGFAFLGQTCS